MLGGASRRFASRRLISAQSRHNLGTFCTMPWLTSSRYRNSIDLSAVGSFGPFFPFPLPPFPLPFLPLPCAHGGRAQTPHAGAWAPPGPRGRRRAFLPPLPPFLPFLPFMSRSNAARRLSSSSSIDLFTCEYTIIRP